MSVWWACVVCGRKQHEDVGMCALCGRAFYRFVNISPWDLVEWAAQRSRNSMLYQQAKRRAAKRAAK